MAKITVWNPSPRKKKALDREQVEKRQAKAVRFLRDVTDDPDLADEIEDLSVEEYAKRKGFELTDNPTRKRKGSKTMKKEDLQAAVRDGVTEALKGAQSLLKQPRRSNPNGQQQSTPPASPVPVKTDQQKILDGVDEAAAALAGGNEDDALDILNDLLDDYDE